MKKLISVMALFLLTLVVFAQEKDKTKGRRNELEMDVMPLLRTVFQNGGTPLYSLTYRHYFNRIAIRSGLGGGYSTVEERVFNDNGRVGDSIFSRVRSRIIGRIGFEFFNQLDKRSAVYYGLDLTYSRSGFIQETYNAPLDIGTSREFNQETISINPLMGYRFKLNDRLSLVMETQMSLFQERTREVFFEAGLAD